MERTGRGTSVGVDDPYAHVERCDHITDDGRCRYALSHESADPAFAAGRANAGFTCPVGDGDWTWADCPHFRARARDRACVRCGLEERRNAIASDRRPLLEEHHLSYADEDGTPGHEITVSLCRWCHAKVHRSWARLSDDVAPDPEAIAERERRRAEEDREGEFATAAERRSDGVDRGAF